MLIDKPKWKTSFNMVSLVRRITGEKRVGHIGTLDPFATGLLVLALGKAVRLVEYLQGLSKVYRARLHLGKVSTSYDPEGTITETGASLEGITEERIREVLKIFQGEIMQTPPIFSALRVDGKRAYKLARKGKEFSLPERKVTIGQITFLKYEKPYLEIEILCSSGTYIRSLTSDIGRILGVGAYLEDLRRLQIDKFCLFDSILGLDMTRHEIDRSFIPLQEIELSLPVVLLSESQVSGLHFGLQPEIELLEPDGFVVQLKNATGDLLAIGKAQSGKLKLSKVFV